MVSEKLYRNTLTPLSEEEKKLKPEIVSFWAPLPSECPFLRGCWDMDISWNYTLF